MPRYLPGRSLPAHTHVPGQSPRPVEAVAGNEPADPRQTFLWGVDLFNAGCYWEAHEVWESLWHAAGRTGPAADFLKGLIKLAAAGVKLREGRPAGLRRHAERARELFAAAAVGESPAAAYDWGLSAAQLAERAAQVAAGELVRYDTLAAASPGQPVAIFAFELRPESPPPA
jgi:hypothetical protein